MIYDYIIIGGGASGMMCAINLARKGQHVLILEKNEKLGKKLYITGKGRCNFTNLSDNKNHIDNIVSNPKFMMSALSRFSAYDTVNFFEDIGLHYKVERGNRVFPASDKSSDVIKVLTEELKKLGVEIKLNTEVESVDKNADLFNLLCIGGEKYTTYSVVVATGGVSYPATGSTGFGYKIAKKFGLNIIRQTPALVGIVLKDAEKSLQGLSLKNVTAQVNNYTSQIGEMLFTDKGVSGPLILTISSLFSKAKLTDEKLLVDLKPALTEEQLLSKFEREFATGEFHNKSLSNYLKSLVPSSLAKVILQKSGLEDVAVKSINLTSQKKIIACLKGLIFTVQGLESIEGAIITSGGVDVKEISPKNMESKKVSGLYFIGEVLDVDALTGGYNLQIAWATARAVL